MIESVYVKAGFWYLGPSGSSLLQHLKEGFWARCVSRAFQTHADDCDCAFFVHVVL